MHLQLSKILEQQKKMLGKPFLFTRIQAGALVARDVASLCTEEAANDGLSIWVPVTTL